MICNIDRSLRDSLEQNAQFFVYPVVQIVLSSMLSNFLRPSLTNVCNKLVGLLLASLFRLVQLKPGAYPKVKILSSAPL